MAKDPLQPRRCAELLAALAAPERLKIVRFLSDGPRNVTEIADMLETPAVNVSHHLNVLKTSRLVRREKRGRFVWYSLRPGVLEESAEAGISREALNLGYCKIVVAMSARDGTGFDGWADGIAAGEAAAGEAVEVDYDTYADGEALLGWTNATATLTAAGPFDGNVYLSELATNLQTRLAAAGTEVGHLKMTLAPDEGTDLGVVNLVRTDGKPEASHTLAEPLEAGELIVNLRAEADPAGLKQAVLLALNNLDGSMGVIAKVEHLEAFRPGRPVPTHRLARG